MNHVRPAKTRGHRPSMRKAATSPSHPRRKLSNSLLALMTICVAVLVYTSLIVSSKTGGDSQAFFSLSTFMDSGIDEFVSPMNRLDVVGKPVVLPQQQGNETVNVQPFVLAAGRGTTGTHTVYYATCKMGLPSVHFRLYCIPGQNATGFVAHSELLTHFQRLRYCLEQQNRTCPEAVSWVKEAKQHIDRLIQSDIDAVHDTPYTHFMSYMIPRAQHLRGEKPIILLSERDPTYWSSRRLDEHSVVPICRDILDNHTAQILSAENSKHHGGYNYFDIFECVDRFNNQSLKFQDMLTTNFDLKDDGKLGLVANAMVQYQGSMRDIATYRVNLFEQDNGKEWKTADLVNDIERQNPNLVKNPKSDLNQKTAQFVYDLWDPMGIYDLDD